MCEFIGVLALPPFGHVQVAAEDGDADLVAGEASGESVDAGAGGLIANEEGGFAETSGAAK